MKIKSKGREFEIICEKTKNNYSCYSDDLPGCIATGKTKKECIKNMKIAIDIHLKDYPCWKGCVCTC